MQQFQRLQHQNMIVEKYRQKMKLLMIRVGIIEEPRLTMARFQSGINLKIRDIVELLTYNGLNDLVQL